MMNKKELEQFEQLLEQRGYRVCESSFKDCEYYWYKPFGQSEYSRDERSNYMVMFCIYDFHRYAISNPLFRESPFTTATYVMVSRTTDERMDLLLPNFGNVPDVEWVEQKAESFFEWSKNNIKVQKEEEA